MAHKSLPSLEYKKSSADTNLYVKRWKDGYAILAVTVDDFCAACTSPRIYKRVLADVQRKYQEKNLGQVIHVFRLFSSP